MKCKACGYDNNPENASKCIICGEILHDSETDSILELFEIGLRKEWLFDSTNSLISLTDQIISEHFKCPQRSNNHFEIELSFEKGKWYINKTGDCNCFLNNINISPNNKTILKDHTLLKITAKNPIWVFAIRIKEEPNELGTCPFCGNKGIKNGECCCCKRKIEKL